MLDGWKVLHATRCIRNPAVDSIVTTRPIYKITNSVTLFCLQCSSYGFLIVDKRDKRFLALFCSRDDDPSDQHEANIAPDQYTWNRRTNISPGKRRLIDIPLQMFVPFVCAQSELLTVT